MLTTHEPKKGQTSLPLRVGANLFALPRLLGQKKKRLDILLLEKGFAKSQNKAQAMIMAGQVRIGKYRVDSLEFRDSQRPTHNSQPLKSGTLLPTDSQIEVKELPRFVSRGGEKLQASIDHWKISVKNKICLDIGCSTGGFTDCLLQNGAKKVYAVDVGYGQLHPKIRNDARVEVFEETHILKWLPPWLTNNSQLIPNFVTIDLSFISLYKVLPKVLEMFNSQPTTHNPQLEFLILLKPQFEVAPPYIRKGIVRDAKVRKEAIEKMINFCTKAPASPEAKRGEREWSPRRPSCDSIGLEIPEHFPCPILGMKGNQEEWMFARPAISEGRSRRFRLTPASPERSCSADETFRNSVLTPNIMGAKKQFSEDVSYRSEEHFLKGFRETEDHIRSGSLLSEPSLGERPFKKAFRATL